MKQHTKIKEFLDNFITSISLNEDIIIIYQLNYK